MIHTRPEEGAPPPQPDENPNKPGEAERHTLEQTPGAAVVRQGLTFLSFLLKAALWGACTYYFAREIAAHKFWLIVASVFIFSIPIALSGMYANTIQQILGLNIFARHGLIFRIFSGRPLKVVIWSCWALLTSFFTLIQFHSYDTLEWIVFFLVIPVFWLIFLLCQRLSTRELKPYMVTSVALQWSRRLTPPLMLVVFLLVSVQFGEPLAYQSIQAAIDAQKDAVADMRGSAVVLEVSEYLALYDGVKAYALGRLGDRENLWTMLILGFGSLVVFYNACATFSCFLISGMEYRRLFGPLTDADLPAPIQPTRIAVIVGITSFLALFIYLPLFASLESWVRQTPEFIEMRRNVEALMVTRVEQIDTTYYQEGTFDELHNARLTALHKVDVSLAHLEGEADRAFDRIEANVDVFLDWYYSLGGEYGRTLNLLVGEIENYTTKKLEESLLQGDAFQNVQSALTSALTTHETAMREYQQAAQKIMDKNRIAQNPASVHIMQKMSISDALSPPIHQDMISLHNRLLMSSGGSAVAVTMTAVVGKKIIGKVVGKNVIKVAAKAMAKVVMSKTAGSAGGAAAGMAAGAAIGSVVPGPGTVIGAAAGGIIGTFTVGVTLDKMLLMLEESFKREEFKNEILAAIREARREFKASIR